MLLLGDTAVRAAALRPSRHVEPGALAQEDAALGDILDLDKVAAEECEAAWGPDRTATFTRHTKLALARAGMHVGEIVPPVDRYVRLHGRLVHFLDWGGLGQPMLFLHGLGLTAHTWNLVCLALRPAYRCYAVDLRGHGDSDWAADGDVLAPGLHG